jgi:membrane fusion protein (multidrug efflux system)
LESETVRTQEYDEAYSRLQAIEAQEELLLAEIAKTEIRAPFSGTIGISKVEVGSYVSPGLELANLQNQESVKIMFSVPERYLPLVKPGSQVTFMTELSEEKLSATITASEAGLDVNNRSLKVQAVAKNPGRNYKGGLSAKVFFNTAAAGTNGIKVPSHALIPGGNGYNVYVIKEGMAKLAPVVVSNRTDSEAIISGGLAAGDTVIVSNIMRLGDGMPVSAVTPQN